MRSESRASFGRAMRELYAPYAGPLVVDGIALFKQADSSSAFTILERFDFAGAR